MFSVKIGVLIFTGNTHMESVVNAHGGFRIWECGQHLLLGEWRVHIGSAVFVLKSSCPKIMDCGLKAVSMRKLADLSGRLSSLLVLFLLLVTHAPASRWALADTHSGGRPGRDGLWPLSSLQFCIKFGSWRIIPRWEKLVPGCIFPTNMWVLWI